jgi:hypothetical protein
MFSLINQRFRLPFAELQADAQSIHDGLAAHAVELPAPNPTLPDFQDDIDALAAAIIAWGPEGARGSRAQHSLLVDAARQVRSDLRMLAFYTMNTQPGNTALWQEVGFTVKDVKSASQPLAAVQNFHQVISIKIPKGLVKLAWELPLDTKPGRVRSYLVQYSNTGVQPQIDGGRGVVNVIGICTKTNIIVTPPFTGANYFWVTGINAVGFGVSSEPVLFNNPGKI